MGAELRFPMHATRRGETPDIPTLFAPQPLKRRSLAAGDSPDLVGIEAANGLLVPVGEPGDPAPRRIAREACYEVPPYDGGTVKPNKQFGVQTLLQRTH